MNLEPVSPVAPMAARQAFGELKLAAQIWLEKLAEILAGSDMYVGPLDDVSDEGANICLEVPLQSENMFVSIAVELEIRPSHERDLTEFRLCFRTKRLLGAVAWVAVILAPEMALLARTLKGGKPVSTVVEQLKEQLQSVGYADYLVFFEDLMQ